jgi:putative heme-binding domain-containing protein
MQLFPGWKVGVFVLLALVATGAALREGDAQVADKPGVPHPVVAWPAGPFEVRVAFTQALDPTVCKAVVGRLIPFEEEVSVLQQAKARDDRPERPEPSPAHRGTLRIVAARLEDNGRTLILATDPHARAATYSLHLTGIRTPGQAAPGESIDMAYGLGGVEAAWEEGQGASKPAWSGWWPDLDPGIVRRLTAGSVAHQRELALLSRPGRITLHTQFVLPKGRHTLHLAANVPIRAIVAGKPAPAANEPGGGQQVEHRVDSTGAPIELTLTLPTGVAGKPTTFKASYLKEENPREVRLAHARLLLPWATTSPSPSVHPPQLPRHLAGGDPERGKTIFFGEKARCSACHTIAGKGANVGPELGHQFMRPPAEVYRDIADPGVQIPPDYLAYKVALKNGRTLVGIVRAEGADSLRVTDAEAKTTVIGRSEIEEFRPSPTSIMPVGVAGSLGDGPFRDLLAFLTHPPTTASTR